MNYGIREKYDQLKKFGDRLSDMDKMIDWESFRQILSDLYENDTDRGGRPNFDPILMVKVLFIQMSWKRFSDHGDMTVLLWEWER